MRDGDCWNDELDVRDSVYGVIIGGCLSGVFVKMENGEEAFSPFGGLNPGTKVFCTMLKKATDDRRALVSIDSVQWDSAA